jgi:hypothetical protein
MAETSFASATTVCTLLAFVLAAVTGITSRQGIRLVLIGIMLSLTPDVSRVVSSLATNGRVRRIHEQHEPGAVQSCRHGS